MIVYYQIHSDMEISILQYKAQAINNITTIINYLLKSKNQLAYWFLNFVFYTFKKTDEAPIYYLYYYII